MKKLFSNIRRVFWYTSVLLLLTVSINVECQRRMPPVKEKDVKTNLPEEKPIQSAWKLYTTGSCGDAVLDLPHECIWFLKDGAVNKLDLKTQESKIITTGSEDKQIKGLSLALEGNHLWVGGHHTGLWMYDIPSNFTMVYNVDNTVEDDKKGLVSNYIEHVYVHKDQIWTYQKNSIGSWGITRFCYKEKEHDKRWRTWNTKNTQSKDSKADGLYSNSITGIMSDGKTGFWVFPSRDYIYQHFDPDSSKFTTFHILPKRNYGIPSEESKVTIYNPYGAKNWGCAAPNYPVMSFLNIRDGKIWLYASVQDDGKWLGADGVGGGCVLCFDPTNKTHIAFSEKSTESRPNARDGLLGYSGYWCFDGDEIWMACNLFMAAAVCRYNTKTKEFTHYLGWNNDDIPNFKNIQDIIAVGDKVYFTTDAGLLCYQKSDKYPKIIKTIPANGSEINSQEKEFIAVFDMPMNPVTITNSSVELLVNKAISAGKVSYDQTRNAVIFTVESGLPSGMEGEFVLKSLIQATNGNPIHWTRIKFVIK